MKLSLDAQLERAGMGREGGGVNPSLRGQVPISMGEVDEVDGVIQGNATEGSSIDVESQQPTKAPKKVVVIEETSAKPVVTPRKKPLTPQPSKRDVRARAPRPQARYEAEDEATFTV
jgi:hypothetical protein